MKFAVGVYCFIKSWGHEVCFDNADIWLIGGQIIEVILY